MITDVLLGVVAAIVGFIVLTLPVGQALNIPALDAVGEALGAVDALVPIAGPLRAALGILVVAAAFITLRLFLLLWNTVRP